jgi:hypothetical protein
MDLTPQAAVKIQLFEKENLPKISFLKKKLNRLNKSIEIEDTKMFAGLRSRWLMPLSFKNLIP